MHARTPTSPRVRPSQSDGATPGPAIGGLPAPRSGRAEAFRRRALTAPLTLVLACAGGSPSDTEAGTQATDDEHLTTTAGMTSGGPSTVTSATTADPESTTTGAASTAGTTSTATTLETSATTGSGTTTDAGTDTNTNTSDTSADATVLIDADFEGARPGEYSEAMVEGDFGAGPSWNNGLDEGRATIVGEPDNTYLRITYPADEYGPSAGGVQFKVLFSDAYDEVYLRYRLRFGDDFEWVKGGKLPGLIGGSAPTGCKDDDTGFSARMMWRVDGLPVQYLYYPTKIESCGDDFPYEVGGDAVSFTPGVWHTVEHRIVMNDPGSSNGVMQAWIDGELALDIQDFAWRGQGSTYAVDGLYFSTFYGGGDTSWAPSSEQTIDYDDFLATTP